MISENSKAYNISNISPKSTIYAANGSGRDSYIFSNNGGLCKKTINNLNIGANSFATYLSHEASATISPKVVHYSPNGTGRDSYIMISSGGLHHDTAYGEYKKVFQESLRTYEASPHSYQRYSRSLSPFKNSLALQTTYVFPKKYNQKIKTDASYQKQLISKLSKPKPKK